MNKLIRVFLVAILLFSTIACSSEKKKDVVLKNADIAQNDYQKSFDKFLIDEYVETMESDALSLHFSLYDKSKYDIVQPVLTLGEISEQNFDASHESLLKTQKSLNDFDYELLNSTQQFNYDVLNDYLNIQLGLSEFEYYDNLFSPASSLTSNLIVNFMEYKFYDLKDAQEYLVLLADVDRFLQDALTYTNKQAELGLFMSDKTVDAIVVELDKFLSKVENNELISDFDNKLSELNIEDDMFNQLSAQNKTIVIDEVLVAYDNVKNTLISLKGNENQSGIFNVENGKEYYEALFLSKTGSMYSVDETYKIANNYLQQLLSEYISILTKNQSVIEKMYENDLETMDPMDILGEFKNNLNDKFPKAIDAQYSVKYLDPTVANDATIAYYLIPQFDNINENVIKINPNAVQDNLELLYTSLAHEGFAGHLYQTTSYLNTSPSPIRTLTSYIGYSEGWAMYAQMVSYEWLYDDADLIRLKQIDVEMSYILQSVIDIGVNYYGWSINDVKNYNKTLGFDDSIELATSLYEFAINDPCLLAPYGFGLMNMNLLKSHAIESLGKKFDLKEFNKVLLENGPCSFTLLKSKVDEYIEMKS